MAEATDMQVYIDIDMNGGMGGMHLGALNECQCQDKTAKGRAILQRTLQLCEGLAPNKRARYQHSPSVPDFCQEKD